ncbi:ABC transporter permease [Clostridium thermobutyricum]|uniref:ABC transporter permease n=1 Tax=Clostridium thermobutyricum TaxID=29372 RepID=UPI00294264D3|nr:ABC transporter permease [Clostridium thermobutyricum]
MTFFSIVKKNFKYNLNKFISYFFVNALVIGMLFMYGSLLFNSVVNKELKGTSLIETLNIALMALIIFAIVFITYTNISFLKNRDKEFGMYLTLGMTRKDLIKIVIFENLSVMILALLVGTLGGAIFGRLFYMALSKILDYINIPYELNIESFVLSAGVFILIFIGNMIFNIIYMNRVSIMSNLKASRNKEVGKSNLMIGSISLILFIIALLLLPQTLLRKLFNGNSVIIGILVFMTIVLPYFIIGSIITVFNKVIQKYTKFYNNEILILSNLSHRFKNYKNILYMLSILIAGAIYFSGTTYAMYSTSKELIDKDNPFDVAFVEKDGFNEVEESELKTLLNKKNIGIKNYSTLEFLEYALFKEENGKYMYYSDSTQIISESNYNRHMKENIDVEKGAGIYISVYNEKIITEDFGVILAALSREELDELSYSMEEYLSKEELESIIGREKLYSIEKEKLKEVRGVNFTNIIYNTNVSSGKAIIVDDDEYESLKKANIKSGNMHLLNIKNEKEIGNILDDYLLKKNNIKKEDWNNGKQILSFEEEVIRGYKPIYKQELIEDSIKYNGMMFFTTIFIGLLFIFANGIVLYYKVLSEIDEERERVKLLRRIGIENKKLRKIISKEMAITFYVPIIIGGGIACYYIYVLFSNHYIVGVVMKNVFEVLIAAIIIQTIICLVSRKKYLKEVLK